ncbi:hypothetical protein SALBM135S_07395 [Streptomyces alboniger]
MLKDFEKSSGYQVSVLKDGDAGAAVNKAILSKDNPQGDVFFGVDNTLLSRALDNGPIEAIWNSLRYALVATAIAVFIGGLAAAALTRRAGRLVRGFDALLMLPLGVSAVTVGFGFLITLDEPPLDLRATWILVPLAQALVGVPFVVRTMLPVLRAVDGRLREAAAVLGASPLRAWREVDLPMVRRALLVAAGFAFAVSLGEFGATVFIARPDNPTLPVAVARLLGRAGDLNYGQAMALSTILMVVCAVSLLLLERLRADRTTGSSDDDGPAEPAGGDGPLRGAGRARRRGPGGRRARDRVRARAEWQRQVDAAAGRRGPPGPPRGAGRARRA